MSTEDQLYRALQVHLDKETIGFPATESGSDTRLLRQLFLPDQAEAAMLLTYRYESIEQIHARSEGAGKSIGELEAILDRHLESNLPTNAPSRTLEEDEAIKERLKALGYL